jgi:transcriptional regulator with XRE-family HTH domain
MRDVSKRGAIVLGPALAAIRKGQKITQTTLARRSKVAEGTIAPIEAGRRQASRETIDALAKALKVPVESFALYVTPEVHDQLAELIPDLVQETRDEVASRAARAADPAA